LKYFEREGGANETGNWLERELVSGRGHFASSRKKVSKSLIARGQIGGKGLEGKYEGDSLERPRQVTKGVAGPKWEGITGDDGSWENAQERTQVQRLGKKGHKGQKEESITTLSPTRFGQGTQGGRPKYHDLVRSRGPRNGNPRGQKGVVGMLPWSGSDLAGGKKKRSCERKLIPGAL